MKWVLIGLIKIYRKFISPCIGPHCIYTPTCSQYAMEAIKKYGAIKGTYLACRRILNLGTRKNMSKQPFFKEK